MPTRLFDVHRNLRLQQPNPKKVKLKVIMTLNLELPPETEARLREIARAQNLAVEEAKSRCRAAIKKVRGCMKGNGLSSDDFLREKHEEARSELEKDEAFWREGEARQSAARNWQSRAPTYGRTPNRETRHFPFFKIRFSAGRRYDRSALVAQSPARRF